MVHPKNIAMDTGNVKRIVQKRRVQMQSANVFKDGMDPNVKHQMRTDKGNKVSKDAQRITCRSKITLNAQKLLITFHMRESIMRNMREMRNPCVTTAVGVLSQPFTTCLITRT